MTVKQTASNHGLASNAAKAIHALDAERLDAEAEIADTEASLRRMYDRAKAAEARVTELRDLLEARVTELRDLLAECYSQTAHLLTSDFADEVRLAALAKEDTA